MSEWTARKKERVAASVLELSTHAHWYAWGYFDNNPAIPGLGAREFSELYGKHVEDAEYARITRRHSIQSAFGLYLQGIRDFS